MNILLAAVGRTLARGVFVATPFGLFAIGALCLVASTPVAPAQGITFSTTGSLATGRYEQTATLLSNGKVLVAGGIGSSSTLGSAELYDPATGMWAATGGLTAVREAHTATLLPNGKVLVAGGFGASSALASAELYDPVSGTWAATGALNTARYSHMATLLPNGEVLVAGGIDSNDNASVSAELYDPATGTWTVTGNLANSRDGATATLLPNGKVLAAGGSSNSAAELYDPATGTWAATGNLVTARYDHTATLLPNGNVLVTGGIGNNTNTTLASSELYDPATGIWNTTGNLNNARFDTAAALLPNGQVLVAGGYYFTGVLASAELYNPASGTWTLSTGQLASARGAHTGTLLPNGEVLVVGGGGNSAPLASAELGKTATGTWTTTGNLNAAREQHTATLLPTGEVLVAGGFNTDDNALASSEFYDPATGTWTITTETLITGREQHTATLLATGLVLVVGGYDADDNPLASAELYDPATERWAATGNLHAGRLEHTATLLPNGQVLVTGGNGDSGTLASAELYDPATGVWTTTGSLNSARFDHTATLLPNGQVLVAAGFNSSFQAQASAELYDPASGTWTTTGSLSAARETHTATLLPNGQVLAAGGFGATTPLTSAELYDPATGMWALTGNLNTPRDQFTATLLPSGQVLAAGGLDVHALASAELYDPASGTWATTGNLNAARILQTATLLPNGEVLVSAGDGMGILATSELFDPGLGFIPDWQPQITSATPMVPDGGALVLSGAAFQGISGASGGSTQDSSTNYPVVQLRSLANEQVAFLLSDPANPWSATRFVSAPVSGFARGYALATVFTNGIPSTAALVLIPPTPTLVEVTIASSNENLRLAKAGDTITLIFTPSEQIQPPTVTIAGHAATSTAFGNDYMATATVAAGDPQGPVSFSIAFADPAGNPGTTVNATTDGSSVSIDTVAPSDFDVSAVPSSGYFAGRQLGNLAQYVSATDASGAVTITQSPGAGTELAAGMLTVTFTATDPAGNAATVKLTLSVEPFEVVAAKDGTVANTTTNATYVSFGAPQPGAFAGIEKTGNLEAPAIFGSDGSELLAAGGAVSGQKIAKVGPLSGDAALVTLDLGGAIKSANKVALITGLAASTPKIAAQTGTTGNGLPAGVTIASFLAIDGQGTDTFFLATLQGTMQGKVLTPADNTALCVAPAGGGVNIVARKGQPVTLGGQTENVSILTTLADSAGTLAANRWRIDDSHFGIRVTFPNKAQAIYSVPATAASAADWSLLTQTGTITAITALNGTAATSFGLPGFGPAGVAQVVHLAAIPGTNGAVTAADNLAVTAGSGIAGFTLLARKGSDAPDAAGAAISGVEFSGLSDPVSGGAGAVAFAGTLANKPPGKTVTAANDHGLWFAADGQTAKLIARTGDPAPGGGHWSTFASMALPADGIHGPIFVGTLARSALDHVTNSNDLGLWAVNSSGAVQLLFRTGVQASGVAVTSFTALAPAARSLGAASGYDESGDAALLVTYADGSQELIVITPP